MILNLIVYLALGLYADFHHLYFLSVFCYVTPFLKEAGMLTAFISGILFFMSDHFIAGLISIGLIIFQLFLNKYWK